MKKPCSFRVLRVCRGGGPVFPLQDVARALEFARRRLSARSHNRLFGNTLRLQFIANSRRTIFPGELAGALLGVAIVRELISRDQEFHQDLERFQRFRVRREFPRKLGAGVLAARKQP